MSRNTKMKQIAAEGMEDVYGGQESDDQYDSEDEEQIDDIMRYYKNQLLRKEVIRALKKNNWNDEDTYQMLDQILDKKKAKNKPNNAQQPPKVSPALPTNNLQPTLPKMGNVLVKRDDQTLKKATNDNNNNKQPQQEAKKVNQEKNQGNEEEVKEDIQELKLKKQSSSINGGVQGTLKLGEYIRFERNVEVYNLPYPEEKYDIPPRHQELDNLNLVIVGHVDSGKSTLIGHLCHLKSIISQKQAHKIQKDSKNIGKESFKYAWVNDEFDAERERGVTIDIGYKTIPTKNKIITFLDAPGHKDFVPNMIQGVTQADYALLVIECTPSSFERGFEFGGQTKEHAFLVKELGVQRLIILINKMDLISWGQDRYCFIQSQLTTFLLSIGFLEKNLIFLPISAFYAENIVEQTAIKEAEWFKGKCLMELLDQLPVPERKNTTPMRLNIYNSFFQKNRGFVLQGKVEGGAIFERQKALIMPQALLILVKDITKEGERVKYACIGDNIEVTISHKEDCEIKSGNVLCCIEHPIPVSKTFILQLCTFQLTYPILKGTQVVMYINTQRFPGVIKKIAAIIDKITGEILKKNPKCIREKEYAQLEVTAENEYCMELYSNFRSFGRVVLRESMNTLGVGKILKIC